MTDFYFWLFNYGVMCLMQRCKGRIEKKYGDRLEITLAIEEIAQLPNVVLFCIQSAIER